MPGSPTSRGSDAQVPPPERLPGCSALSVLLHDGPDLLAAAHNFRSWPQGARFTVLLLRPPTVRGDPAAPPSLRSLYAGLQIGVRHADGTESWYAFYRHHPVVDHGQHARQLIPLGGGSWSQDIERLDWWMQPLPTATVHLALRCPQPRLSPTWHDLDTDELAAASHRSHPAAWVR